MCVAEYPFFFFCLFYFCFVLFSCSPHRRLSRKQLVIMCPLVYKDYKFHLKQIQVKNKNPYSNALNAPFVRARVFCSPHLQTTLQPICGGTVN